MNNLFIFLILILIFVKLLKNNIDRFSNMHLIMKPRFWERRGRVKLLIFHKVQRERAAINLASWEKQPEFTFRLRRVHKKRRYFTPNVLTLIIISLQLLEKKICIFLIDNYVFLDTYKYRMKIDPFLLRLHRQNVFKVVQCTYWVDRILPQICSASA